MKNRTVIIVLVCGIIIGFGFAATMGGRIFKNRAMALGQPEEQLIQTTENFDVVNTIQIDVDTANIELIAAPAGSNFKMELKYYSYEKIDYKIDAGTLKIWSPPVRRRVMNLTQYSEGSVKIYYPSDMDFTDINIKNDTGNIDIDKLKAANVYVYADYGDILSKGITAEKIAIEMDSGNAKLNEWEAADVSISNDYGDVEIDQAAIANGSIKLDSGNLTISNVSGSLFAELDYGNLVGDAVVLTRLGINIDSGDVRLAGSLDGTGDIQSDYGNVTLSLGEIENRGYSLTTDYGKITVNGVKQPEKAGNPSEAQYFKEGLNTITVQCDAGDIVIK